MIPIRPLALLSLATAVSLVAVYCGSAAPVRRPLPQPNPASPEGARLYGKFCALCHGEDGEGYRADEATALANPDFLTYATDDFIAANTSRGRPGTPMSPWGVEHGGALSAADVQAVVAHVRSWQTEVAIDVSEVVVEADPARGERPYIVHCETCHGEQGRGGTAMTLNNPVFQETASQGFVHASIAHGRRGTKMKAYRDKLGGRDIDRLVAFVEAMPEAPVSSNLGPRASADGPGPPAPAAVLNPGSPAADFDLREGRFAAADDVHAALEAGQSFLILDARPHSDYLISHIAGASSVPFYDVERRLGELPRDLWIITYCGCPHAISGQALDVLRANGFEKSAVLDEGFYVWGDRGYPIVEP